MTKETQLIKKLARELKYLSLSELFGRQVMIHTVDKAFDGRLEAILLEINEKLWQEDG